MEPNLQTTQSEAVDAKIPRAEVYRRILAEAFPEYAFSDQASRTWRFAIFHRLLASLALPAGSRLLNVGCGPLALEVLSDALRPFSVTSFDYTPQFLAVHRALRDGGMLGDIDFQIADAREVAFPDAHFDMIVFHDIFYETALSAPDLVARYRRFLKPGGHVYLDLMDQRAAPIWRLMGAERPEYRRYDVAAALGAMTAAGFDVRARRPTEENRVGAKRILLSTIRRLTGVSNGYGVLLRRRD